MASTIGTRPLLFLYHFGRAQSGTIYYNATESASITVSSSKHTIHSIKITYTGTSYNKGKVLVNGNEVTGTDGTYSINSNSFVVTNGNTSSAQVRISSIEITYN